MLIRGLLLIKNIDQLPLWYQMSVTSSMIGRADNEDSHANARLAATSPLSLNDREEPAFLDTVGLLLLSVWNHIK